VRELGKISSGVLGHLDETRLLLARLTLLLFLGSPHQALETLIIVEHAHSTQFHLHKFIDLPCPVIFGFHPSSSLLLCFYCVPPYTHGSYSYWIVWLLFFPFYLYIFLLCNTTRIHSLVALQRCNTWISLEFLWNSTYIGTCCLDCWHNNGYSSHIIWIYGFIKYHNGGKQGFTGFTMVIIAWLWLQLHVVHYEHVVFKKNRHGLYTLYTLKNTLP